jgi:hypothetical protein
MPRFIRRDGKADLRRRHPHFRVTVVYEDSEEFGRVYNDIQKAEKFAARQERSPVVKAAHINRIR